jgi:ribosome-associated protein
VTIEKPSKNARKREQRALQELGEFLIPLKPVELDSIGLSEDLLEAVRAAARMKSREALRRQKQLIGKLMRQADAERIRSRLAELGARDRAEKQAFGRAEKWRDRLLTGGADALAEFESTAGGTDDELRDLLRQLNVTVNERAERTLKRQVFRRVHAILVKIPA